MKLVERLLTGLGGAAAISVILSPAILLAIFVKRWWAWLPLALEFLYVLGAILDGCEVEDKA